MTEHSRSAVLERIRTNIGRFGQHIYSIVGGPSPRFSYTVGVSPEAGFELVLAGASYYSTSDTAHALGEIAAYARREAIARSSRLAIKSLGTFSFRPAHESWVSAMMLGALDFYEVKNVEALQVVPDDLHWTLDVPDMSKPWNASVEPVWQWLHAPWPYDVPRESVATTNLDALRGEKITEAARWEENKWELFAGPGPEVAADEARAVPLGTLLALDESLAPVTKLNVGQALWRDAGERHWHAWGCAH